MFKRGEKTLNPNVIGKSAINVISVIRIGMSASVISVMTIGGIVRNVIINVTKIGTSALSVITTFIMTVVIVDLVA